MSEIKKISGIVNSITKVSSTSGSIDQTYDSDDRPHVKGKITTQHVTNFRVNGTPCYFKGTPNLSNGDQVTIVGKNKGELDVLVLFNETTNLRYTGKRYNKLYLYILYSFSIIFSGLALIIISGGGLKDSLGVIMLLFVLFFDMSFLIKAVEVKQSIKEMNYALRMLHN